MKLNLNSIQLGNFKSYEEIIDMILDGWEYDMTEYDDYDRDIKEFIYDGLYENIPSFRKIWEGASQESQDAFDKELEKFLKKYFGDEDDEIIEESFDSFLSKVKKGLISASIITTMMNSDALSQEQKKELELARKTVYSEPKHHSFNPNTLNVINAVRTELNLNKPIKDIQYKDIKNAINKTQDMAPEEFKKIMEKYKIPENDLKIFSSEFNKIQYGNMQPDLKIPNEGFKIFSKVINLIKFLKDSQQKIITSKEKVPQVSKTLPAGAFGKMSGELYPYKK